VQAGNPGKTEEEDRNQEMGNIFLSSNGEDMARRERTSFLKGQVITSLRLVLVKVKYNWDGW
jgi:hypothetical protein